MANGSPSLASAFVSIWTEPRATIRRIVDTDPTHYVIGLAVAGPVVFSLYSQWSQALQDNANLSVLWPLWVALAVASQAILGVIILYLNAALFKWSGALLGGVANRVEVRAAIAWSQIPTITLAVVMLAALLAGIPMPKVVPGEQFKIDSAFYRVLVIGSVLGIWGLVVQLKCLAEVHRFSTWRALGAVLLPIGILVVSLFVLFYLLFKVLGNH